MLVTFQLWGNGAGKCSSSVRAARESRKKEERKETG